MNNYKIVIVAQKRDEFGGVSVLCKSGLCTSPSKEAAKDFAHLEAGKHGYLPTQILLLEIIAREDIPFAPQALKGASYMVEPEEPEEPEADEEPPR